MTDTVIRVANRSKLHRLGAREKGYKTFREALMDLAAADFELTVFSFQLTVPTINRQPSTTWELGKTETRRLPLPSEGRGCGG